MTAWINSLTHRDICRSAKTRRASAVFAFFFEGVGKMQARKTDVRQGDSLKRGVLFLTLANLFVKVLGFAYKVPLNTLLGDEMANVNAAAALFAVLYTAMAAGVPGALSLSISRARAVKDGARIKKLFDTTLLLLLAVGFLLSLLLFLLAKPLSLLDGDGTGYLCTLAIAPALFFTAVTSVLRGFFQGFSRLIPTAVSELFEALGKAGFGVAFAFLSVRILERSVSVAAALAVFGITLGIMLGTLFLALWYGREKRALLAPLDMNGEVETKSAFRAVFLLALPITLSSALMSVGSFIDARMMRPLLEDYFGDPLLAKALYSDYSTGALTLYNLPSVLILPISTALIPYISGAVASGHKERARKVTTEALKLSILISLPAALGMSVLASPILTFVFRSDTDMGENAGASLSVLALCVLFSAILTVTSAALQSFKRERIPILSIGVGVLMKLLVIKPLVAQFGTVGVPLSTLAFMMTAAMLNLILLCKTASLRPRFFDTLLRPLFCAAPTAAVAYFTHKGLILHIGENTALLLSVLLAAFVYVALAFLTRAVSEEELSLLPFVKSRQEKKSSRK